MAEAPVRRKLSYREQRELESLPARIEALEADHARLESQVAAPDFYKQDAGAITGSLERVKQLEHELLDAYERLDLLKARA